MVNLRGRGIRVWFVAVLCGVRSDVGIFELEYEGSTIF